MNTKHLNNTPTLQTYLAVKSMANRYQSSVPTIWRWSREGTIPKPIKIGGSTRWKLSEIEAWEAMKGDEK
jgi:predicted DNA-binding transcriptional regulator AlpA